MSNLIINAKVFSLGGEFWVTDEAENPRYQVKGSLLRIPKQFHIYDEQGRDLAKVTHSSIRPHFTLEIGGEHVAEVQQKFGFLMPRWSIDAHGVKVVGNIRTMNFEVQRGSAVIGRIDSQWSVRHKHRVEVLDSHDELLVLGLVLAIDCVKNVASR
ncbi:MAG: hypothetical protein JO082_16400 [Mycobacterium sp.]|nr:hypothetical protein [Mycobacterium sp.]